METQNEQGKFYILFFLIIKIILFFFHLDSQLRIQLIEKFQKQNIHSYEEAIELTG